MAVLCPMHGEGSSCPMVYKTLNIGQGEMHLYWVALSVGDIWGLL